MKKIIILMLLVSSLVNAQEEIKIGSKYGVDVTYQLLKTKETKKKDVYLLVVNAINTTDSDLYYATKQSGPVFENSSVFDNGFTRIMVRNALGIFKKGNSVRGNSLGINTTKGMLSVVKSGEIYTFESSFRVHKGVKPLITNTFTNQLEPYENFTILLNSSIVKGEWGTTCGNATMSLDFVNRKVVDNTHGYGYEKALEVISQVVNGRQFFWLKVADNSFVREDNKDYTLSYNNDTGLFTYSSSDGVTCNWNKL